VKEDENTENARAKTSGARSLLKRSYYPPPFELSDENRDKMAGWCEFQDRYRSVIEKHREDFNRGGR